MRRTARFIGPASQRPDPEATFRHLVSRGPWRRDDGGNRWYLYRRKFTVPFAPSAGDIDITADGRYQLFVNDQRLGRGPSRCSPYFQRVDRHDACGRLRRGDNVLAVLVHVYGGDTAWYEQSRNYWQSIFGDGGLFVSATCTDGVDELKVDTDRNWRCLECDAWNRNTPKSGWGQDFIEDFDARRLPEGWTSTEYDDSAWRNSTEMYVDTDDDDRAKGWGPIEPFPLLVPREISQLAEQKLEANALVAIYSTVADADLPIDRRIYEEALKPANDDAVERPRALLRNDDDFTVVRTTKDNDTVLLIEFDRLHSGYPFIELDAEGGEIVEVAVAETVPGEFTGSVRMPMRVSRESYLDCAHVFRYTAKRGPQHFEKFEWTAVRYLQIVVRNAPNGLRIRHCGSNYTHYPAENLGAFKCSDALLNRLWDMGRYTTLQCTHDAWEDCPGREKRQWLGDGAVHFLIGAAAFGPSTQPIDRQFLLHGMESQRPDGLLQMFSPGDHHTDGIVIPDFNLHWISAAHHYFMHYGDLDTVAGLFPAMQKVLAWFDRCVGPNGVLVDLPYWHFIEWANLDRSGESLPVNAMWIGALHAAADLARNLGYGRAESAWLEQAQQASVTLNQRHWDDARGVYVDSVDPVTGTQARQVSQQSNALMIYHGIAPHLRWARIIGRITDPGRLKLSAVPPMVTTQSAFDVEKDVVLANTYFSHFVFGSLGKARRFDLALAQMRRFYEPMLSTGTTTLWESFEPAASLCHAFSATPVYHLSACALGVEPDEPGFGKIRLAPQSGGLDSARGIYPTVRGDVAVAWQAGEAGFDLDVTIPEGATATLVAPPGYIAPAENIIGTGRHSLRLLREGRADG